MCLSIPCLNGGSCLMTNSTSFTCLCLRNFTGEFCENSDDKCFNYMCQNGGYCIETDGNPVCECSSDYEGKISTACTIFQHQIIKVNCLLSGEFCERKFDYCASQPCQRGKCINTERGFTCQCPIGFAGRRCDHKPCDFIPCHRNAFCIDSFVSSTSNSSYICKCPVGLKGFDCTEIDNPCDQNPCKNNAKCSPLAIRNLKIISQPLVDEEVYHRFICECPPYFYGDTCDILITPDFVMEFTKSDIGDYVQLEGPMKNLSEVVFLLI